MFLGLDPAFTIHDREDRADLMNLVRHELGFSKMECRFPAKGICLAIYSRAVNAELPFEEVLRGFYPWCAGWSMQLRELFGQADTEWRRRSAIRCSPMILAAASIMCWSMNTRTPTVCSPQS